MFGLVLRLRVFEGYLFKGLQPGGKCTSVM